MSSTETTDEPGVFPLNFSLQPGFTAIDLAESAQDRAEKMLDSLQRNMPELGVEEHLRAIMAYEYSVRRMREEGVIYAANFVGRSSEDSSTATTAQFSVVLQAAELKASQPLTIPAEELRKRPSCKVDFVDLPVGRSLVVVEETTLQPEVNLAGHDSAPQRRTRQFQVIIPLSSRDELAIFSLATECLQDWDDYVGMMAEICKTISWREDQRSSIESKLAGL